MEGGTNRFSISPETLNFFGMTQEEFVQAFKVAIQESRIKKRKKRMEEENKYWIEQVIEIQKRILLGIEPSYDLPISEDLREYLFRELPEERLSEIRESLTPEWKERFDEGIHDYRQD